MPAAAHPLRRRPDRIRGRRAWACRPPCFL